MSETLIHRLTVEEFIAMAKSGEIAEDARVELWDGEIIDMHPIGEFHYDALDWLTDEFGRLNRDRWSIRVQGPLRLDKYSLPQPDLMLMQRRRYRRGHPQPSEVYLLIEVAESSLHSDKTKKIPRYAKAGIQEVWLVDEVHSLVEVYREPTPAGYANVTVAKLGETVSPLAFPDVTLKLSEMFDME